MSRLTRFAFRLGIGARNRSSRTKRTQCTIHPRIVHPQHDAQKGQIMTDPTAQTFDQIVQIIEEAETEEDHAVQVQRVKILDLFAKYPGGSWSE